MRGFCYFLPSNLSLATIREMTLPCLSDAPSIATRASANGPAAKGGTLVWRDGEGVKPWKFQAERQEWAKVPAGMIGNSHEYWIGFDKKDRPGPKSLQVGEYHGKEVEIDGQRWRIPVLLKLPKALTWTDAGLRYVAKEKYHDLIERGEQFFMARYAASKEHGIVNDEWIARFAVDLLALNYAVDFPEVGLLQMLDTKNVLGILDTALDIEAIAEYVVELDDNGEVIKANVESKKNETSEPGSSGAATSTSGAAAG